MAVSPAATLLRHLRSMTNPRALTEKPDALLLNEFVTHRDEAAFAALLHRHGRLVWGVCRHVLPREHDAEDAFQATFLVLARRATSIRRSDAVASWLHGVAYRIARKARTVAIKRNRREVPLEIDPPTAS